MQNNAVLADDREAVEHERARLGRRRFFAAAAVPLVAAVSAAGVAPTADAATVADAAPGLPTATIAELRSMTGPPAEELCLVTDAGMEGVFRVDPDDTTSADNTGTVVVGANGVRFKRVFSGALNVRWFGAKGDGETDDADAIQRAVDAAQASLLAVYIPSTAGYYPVSKPVVLDSAKNGIRIFGDVMNSQGGSRLASHSSVSLDDPIEAIFLFTDTTRAQYFEFEHLSLICQYKVKYGIYSAELTSTTVRRVIIGYTTVAGMAFGYGYYNRIENCHFYNTYGDGLLVVNNNANTLNIVNSMFRSNRRAGINIGRFGLGIRIEGCDLEGNQGCGIFIGDQCQSVVISSCYFELNGEQGYTFTEPQRIVKSEIIVDGTATEGALAGDTPAGPIALRDNYVYLTRNRHADSYVACYGSQIGLEISGASFRTTQLPADYATVRTGTSKTGPGAWLESLRIHGVGVGADSRSLISLSPLAVDDLAGGVSALHNADIEGVYRTNYAPALMRFRPMSHGDAGSWRATGTHYRQGAVYQLGGSGEWGFSVDIDSAPELAGRHVYFACLVKASDEQTAAILSTSQLGPCDAGYLASTDWRVVSYVDKMPESGVVDWSIKMTSAGADSTLLVARPVLSEVGVRYDAFDAS